MEKDGKNSCLNLQSRIGKQNIKREAGQSVAQEFVENYNTVNGAIKTSDVAISIQRVWEMKLKKTGMV